MTYGVDECRVCGKAMKPSGPKEMQRHLASLRGHPTMTEKQWRAAGLKAAPTKRQMVSLHHGCCYDCTMTMGMRSVPQRRLIYPALIIAVIVALTMFFIGSRFT